MILAVDIGNTYIVVGCIRDDEIVFVERLHTDTKKSELEYAISIKTVLEIYGVDKKELAGAILSSAVPPLTGVMRRAAGKVTGREPLVVGPGAGCPGKGRQHGYHWSRRPGWQDCSDTVRFHRPGHPG